MLKNKYLLCLIVAFSFLLVKVKGLQHLLPKKVLNQLPLGWTDEMYWTVLKSGGKKVYVDIPCELHQPDNYNSKVIVDSAYQLTETDIQFFYKNGYLGPFTLMSSAEAKALKTQLEQSLAQESPIYPYSQNAYVINAKDRSSTRNSVRSNYETSYFAMNYRDRHLDQPALLNLFQHPALTERCAQLLGPDLLLWRTQFFPKEPGEAGTPLHQASSYLLDNMKEPVVYPPNRNDLFQLTCWIALTQASQENGCMTVVKGTQNTIHPLKISRQYDTQNDDDQNKRFGTAKIEVDCSIEPEQVIPIEMEAGQFFIFSERTLHGSLRNTSQQQRLAVNGRIICPDTRLYTESMLTEGHSYKVVGVSDISLDHWETVLVRGEDRFGYNRVRADIKPQMEADTTPALGTM